MTTMDEITMNQIQMDKDDVKHQIEVIYMAQMQMAKQWIQDSTNGELWPLVDELVRNLESELGMVA
tara:strand:- start:296 stop:493 length:198 start_codon:yes stop_codon:yes gene_type:complete